MWGKGRENARAWLVGWVVAAGIVLALPAAAQVELPETPEESVAEAPAPPDPALLERLRSPRATMSAFLAAMGDLWTQPNAWGSALSCLELGSLDEVAGRNRARQLYGALNRIALVDIEELPDVTEAGDLERFTWFPDRQRDRALLRRIGTPAGGITLRRDPDGAWRFDAETLAGLPDLSRQLESQPLVAGTEILTVADWIESKLPAPVVRRSLLGVKLWTWAAIFVVILLGFVVDLLVRGLLRGASHRVAGRLETVEDPEQLRRTLRPIGLAAATATWLIPVSLLDLEPTIDLILTSALQILLVLFGTLSAWRLIDLTAGFLTVRAARPEGRIDDILVPLVSRTVKLFVLTMGVVYGADALDIPITPLLASLTVAGVGFSFAAKDTVENFFGSVAVVLDRPFDIGDWIVIDDIEGMVEEVGFRSTRVRTFYNSLITMPNSNLVKAHVDNYGRRQYRRWKTTLSLEYGTKPDDLVAFTEGVRELIRNHPYTRKDYYQVWCNEFGASSLDVMLYMFFEVPDWNTELRERERLFLDIVRLADALGVSFAFPTQTLHVFPGSEPGPAGAPPGPGSEAQAGRSGIIAAQRIMRSQPWRQERPGPVALATGPTAVELDEAGNPIEPTEPDEPTEPE
jgi:MscS family membrane protein